MPTPYIMIKKEVDVTEISYIHSIWSRGKDLKQSPLYEPYSMHNNSINKLEAHMITIA